MPFRFQGDILLISLRHPRISFRFRWEFLFDPQGFLRSPRFFRMPVKSHGFHLEFRQNPRDWTSLEVIRISEAPPWVLTGIDGNLKEIPSTILNGSQRQSTGNPKDIFWDLKEIERISK